VSARPTLQLIDTETGEVKGECPRCVDLESEVQRLEDIVTSLERDIRAWGIRYQELKRDKAQSAKHHPLYSEVEIVFREWQRLCNHPRSPFTADRFWIALPYYENPKYGLKMMILAVKGAAYDPFEPMRRNGTRKRLDEWERIFKDAGSFEDFCNRAPRSDESAVSSTQPADKS